MKVRNKLITIGLLVIMLILNGCSVNSNSKVTTFELKAGHVTAEDHPYQVALEYFGELIEERSDGRITLDVFSSSQLGGERELVEGLQMGIVDIAVTAAAPVTNFAPNFAVFDLPYLFEDKEHAYRVLDGDIGQGLLDSLEEVDIKGLSFFENGYFNILNSEKSLDTTEDLKGLRIRTMENEIYQNIYNELGATAIPMAWGETYTAIQNGTVDGATVSIATIETSKMYEVAPYISLSEEVYVPAPVLMSKKTFDKLPSDLQDIVIESINDTRDFERELLASQEEEQLKSMEENGAIITKPNTEEWKEKIIDKVYSKFIPSKIDVEIIEKIKDSK